MKKKFMILILTVLAVLCLSCIAGCSLFGGDGDGGDGGYSPPIPDTSDLKAPEWVRLDLRWKVLYVPDCSQSGVTYYEIIQDWGSGTHTLRTLDTAATQYPNYDSETGCYIFDVSALVDATSFSITVKCKAKSSDSQSVSKTFEFVEGDAIVYDKEHCTFDSDSGLFTWTEVDGAVGYMINRNMYVEEPKYTVPSFVDSITVAPLYDTNKIGVPVTVSFGGVRADIDYDVQTECITWNDVADSYVMEITDGGETLTFELTQTSLHYVPVTEHVDIKLITIVALRRNGVTNGSLDCLPRVAAISVDKFSRQVSWAAISGITEYDVLIDAGDGEPAYKRLSANGFTLENVSVGTVTVKIKAFDSSRPGMIAFYNEFTVEVLPAVQALSPSLSYDSENEKLTVSFDTDPAVEKYTVMLSMNTYTTTDVYPAETDSAHFEVDLAHYEMGNILIIRRFKEDDGNYCYVSTDSLGSYSKSVIYLPAPEVQLIDDNAPSTGGRAFRIGVKYPTELANSRGTLSLTYKYGISSRTVTMSDDMQFTLALSSFTQTLTVYFSAYATGNNLILFNDDFETAVSSLPAVELSADAQKLSWTQAEGATAYNVEELIEGQYIEVQRGADTQYLHGIDDPGYTHTYRVTAVSDGSNPFSFDSYSDDYNVMKLSKPYVSSFTAEGRIAFAAATDSVIVTVLDGRAVTLTDAAILNALTGKTSATLLTYATRAKQANTTYIDSDTDAYTLSRIPDIDMGGLNLKVDASTGTVFWDEPENAENCTRLLYRKTSEEEEYAPFKEYGGALSELDGSELPYGLYEISVRPASRREGNTFYMYYGDTASDTFRKDGVRSVGLLSDGTGFTIDGFIASGDYDASWSVSSNYERNKSYAFAMGDSIIISQNAEFQTLVTSGFNRGTYTLTFNVDYGVADAVLGANKTLKASGYPMPLTIKESRVGDFSGKYSYVERQYNYQPVQIAVTLTPDDYTLRALESYAVFYRVNGDFVSETPGNEVTVTVSGYHTIQRFYLGIKSDKFIEEDGAAVFYRSTDVSFSNLDTWYNVALQETIYPTATNVEHDASNKKVSFHLTMIGVSEYYFNGEKFTFEYLSENGTWITARQYTMIGNTGKLDVTFNYTAMPKTDSNGQISIRIRWDERIVDGVKYEASDWAYLTIALP